MNDECKPSEKCLVGYRADDDDWECKCPALLQPYIYTHVCVMLEINDACLLLLNTDCNKALFVRNLNKRM